MTVEIHIQPEGSRHVPNSYHDGFSYLTDLNSCEETEVKVPVPTSPEIRVLTSDILSDTAKLKKKPVLLANSLSASSSICSVCSHVRRTSTSSLPVRYDDREKNECFHERNVHSDTEDATELTSLKSFKCLSSHQNKSSLKKTKLLNGSPASHASSRPYSPQPGPSGYHGQKGKGKTSASVKFSKLLGKYASIMASDSSDNINSTACTASVNDSEDEPRNTAADRGTLYCACAIIICIVVMVILLVKFA